MLNPKDRKLPLIKIKPLSPKNTPSINKKCQSKKKKMTCETERCTRKLSLKQQQNSKKQKRTLSKKKFSLKKIVSSKALKSLKDIEANTDDNSDNGESRQKYQQKDKKNLQIKSITQKALNLLKGLKQVEKVARLYKKPQQLSKNCQNNQESKRILKNKYKCLVNPHVFGRKLKTNKSEVVKSYIDQKNKKLYSDMNDNYWDQIDQSLIIQSCRHEEPSKQLMDLVGNILTNC